MKRRANGEGSVYKRPNGSWSALVTVTMLNGDKKRKCVTARTRDAVSAKMRELLEQENRQIPHTEKAWTVSEYLDYWMQEIQINRTRETTMASYKVAIKNYIRPVLGNRKLRDLSTFDVRRALDSLQERGFSARTRLEFLRILSSCLSCAIESVVGLVAMRAVVVVIRASAEKKVMSLTRAENLRRISLGNFALE